MESKFSDNIIFMMKKIQDLRPESTMEHVSPKTSKRKTSVTETSKSSPKKSKVPPDDEAKDGEHEGLNSECSSGNNDIQELKNRTEAGLEKGSENEKEAFHTGMESSKNKAGGDDDSTKTDAQDNASDMMSDNESKTEIKVDDPLSVKGTGPCTQEAFISENLTPRGMTLFQQLIQRDAEYQEILVQQAQRMASLRQEVNRLKQENKNLKKELDKLRRERDKLRERYIQLRKINSILRQFYLDKLLKDDWEQELKALKNGITNPLYEDTHHVTVFGFTFSDIMESQSDTNDSDSSSESD